MATLTQHTINEKIYIDLKQVLNSCKNYCKGIRSIKQLIQAKSFSDYLYGEVVDGNIHIRDNLKRAANYSVYVHKDELNVLFDDASNEPLPAPPIITDNDLVFFKDEEGNEYDVCMRGERTKDGIYFKAKDVAKVFNMKHLLDIATKDQTGYELGKHYQWLLVPKSNNVRNLHNSTKELYFTYAGMIRVINVSRYGIGHKFKAWIDEMVFAMNWGTQEQKVKVVARALDVDGDNLRLIMNKCAYKISCLYLIDINEVTNDGKRIYKLGYTGDIRKRFSEHVRKYGTMIKLSTFAFVPINDCSAAESRLKRMTKPYYFNRDGEQELIQLNKEELTSVIGLYETLSHQYCGNMKYLIDQHRAIVEQLCNSYEMQISHLNRECNEKVMQLRLDISNERLEMQTKLMQLEMMHALAKKDLEILQLRISQQN